MQYIKIRPDCSARPVPCAGRPSLSMTLLVLTASLMAGCGENDKSPPRTDSALEQALMTAVTEAANRAEVPSVILRVKGEGVDFSGTAGTRELGGGATVTASDAFFINSVTKPFTAAAAILAAEQGLLSLDQPVVELLPSSVTDGLHVIDGIDDTARITVRHLLAHRSGLADYFFDGADEQGSPPFVVGLFGDPTRIWQPNELVQWNKENLEPVGPVGAQYHYSDTGYVLVGMILERVYGLSLGEVFDAQIFQPLGMQNTWMFIREAPRLPDGGDITHVYLDQSDLTDMPSMSADWAGGGLVSTTADLDRFLSATSSGRLFSDPTSSDALFDYQAIGDGTDYGLGFQRIQAPGIVLEGHGGFGGAFMFREASSGITYYGTVNQANTDADILSEAIGLITANRSDQP